MNQTLLKKRLFGKHIEIIVYDLESKKAKKILKKTYKEALRLQKIFNFFDKKSELSKLNVKKEKEVSSELLKVIKDALTFSKLTEGMYDITLGKKILERKLHLNESPISSDYKDIKIEDKKIILKNPETKIDLGSIAKGYITDKLAEFLSKNGAEEFVINSRGDIVFSGKRIHTIGIQHPREKERNLFLIDIKNEAVATSGDYNQYFGSFETSHIINSKDAISITVIAKTLEEADAFSTALFVVDEKKRNQLIRSNPSIKVLIVKKGMKIEMFNNFEGAIHKNE